MRKMKWFSLLAVIAAFFLAFLSPLPASADTGVYVIDEAGMLTNEELASLNELAEEISLRQECGVYVIVTQDMHGYRESSYAQGIFMNYDLGYDRGNKDAPSGVLLAIALEESYFDCTAYGAASDVFGTRQLDSLNDLAYEYLAEGDWAGCVRGFINECDSILTESGYTYYEPTYTDPTIDPTTVVTSPAERRAKWLASLPLAGLVSSAISGISVFLMKGKNKNIGLATHANEYVIKNGVKLTASHDQFTGKTRSVTHIHRDSGGGGGGGGGGHSYHSSGFSHSSGGRHF